MNQSAAERLADQRAIELAVDLELQLEKGAGTRPMLAILAKAREQATLAMNTLVYADASNAELVRGLQNEIRRYDDLVAWCRELVVEGREADRRIREGDRLDFENIILSPEVAQEARAIGVEPQGYDA